MSSGRTRWMMERARRPEEEALKAEKDGRREELVDAGG